MEEESGSCELRATAPSPDRYEFKLPSDRYDAFIGLFDAGSKPRPRLERLLAEAIVLE